MMVESDYLMRQIKGVIRVIAGLFYKKEKMVESSGILLQDEQALLLEEELVLLIADNRISDAEDLLYHRIEEGTQSLLGVGLNFYERLNDLPDAVLEANDFSREEVYEGLEDLLETFGIADLNPLKPTDGGYD